MTDPRAWEEPTGRERRRGRWPRRPRTPSTAAGSAGLAVRGVLAATGAELLQLDAVRVVAAVFARDVVALLALRTRHRDLWTNIGRLGHGGVPFSGSGMSSGVRA